MSAPNLNVFHNIRNIQRRSSILPKHQDIITSAKQLKKIRSTQQININTFMDNKNQKIKNIDVKLEIHQSQIQRNNRIIQELTTQFFYIKQQFNKEKQKTQIQQRKNKLLKEQIQRTNKLLKTKTIKVDELTKIKEDLQKQLQPYKALQAKNEQNLKTIAYYKKQIINLQQVSNEAKLKINENQKDLLKTKEKISQINSLKIQIDKLSSQDKHKDSIINNLKTSINELTKQKDRNSSDKNYYERQMKQLQKIVQQLKQSKKVLQKQYESLDKKYQETNKKLQSFQIDKDSYLAKAKNSQSEENTARTQLKQMKLKNEQLISKFNQKTIQLNTQSIRVQKLNQRVKQLQQKLTQTRQQKSKLLQMQVKFLQLKRKGKNLQVLYNQMTPQVQCPFGHELKQPITIIPCGHSYCLGCKKGYQKECCQCKGKLKIQAVYRNQLMDDIINMVTGIRQIVELVRQKQ